MPCEETLKSGVVGQVMPDIFILYDSIIRRHCRSNYGQPLHDLHHPIGFNVNDVYSTSVYITLLPSHFSCNYILLALLNFYWLISGLGYIVNSPDFITYL